MLYAKEKQKVEQEFQWWDVTGHSFKQDRIGLLEKELFEQRLVGGEGIGCVTVWG